MSPYCIVNGKLYLPLAKLEPNTNACLAQRITVENIDSGRDYTPRLLVAAPIASASVALFQPCFGRSSVSVGAVVYA